MVKSSPAVTEYIGSFPRDRQQVLRAIRRAMREAVSDGEEVISYQMPALKYHGGVVLYYAAWKEHYSLYPITESLMAKFGDRLKGHVASKGTIKYSYDEPVPVKLITAMAKFRAAEIRRAFEAKAKAGKKTRAKSK
jgi:uncharacterized protein YdhG (YjbR/CyaY superfamily)